MRPPPEPLTLTIPDFVPDARLGLNGRRRAHWTLIRELQYDVFWRVVAAILAARRGNGWKLPHARVTVVMVFPRRRRRDLDNLFGRVKPICDALVASGVIVDDDVNHIDLVLRSLVERGVTETRIRVEALAEPPAAGGTELAGATREERR